MFTAGAIGALASAKLAIELIQKPVTGSSIPLFPEHVDVRDFVEVGDKVKLFLLVTDVDLDYSSGEVDITFANGFSLSYPRHIAINVIPGRTPR